MKENKINSNSKKQIKCVGTQEQLTKGKECDPFLDYDALGYDADVVTCAGAGLLLPTEVVLKLSINHILTALDELNQAENSDMKNLQNHDADHDFVLGEKTAFVECLEVLKLWDKAGENGVDFNIEERFPLR